MNKLEGDILCRLAFRIVARVIDFDNRWNICLQSQEELREARKVYEELNTDLHLELPALYERCLLADFELWLLFESLIDHSLGEIANLRPMLTTFVFSC